MIGFDKNGTECVIPSGKYPSPLKHFISNEKYGIMIEHNGGGYGSSPVIEGRFINYFDFKEPAQTGRFVYLKDQISKEVWNLCRPDKRLKREVRYGLGWASISTKDRGLKTKFFVTVPEGELPVEIWELSFHNSSTKKRKLAFFTYIEFFLGGGLNSWDEPEWYTNANFDSKEKVLKVKLYLPEKDHDNEVGAFMLPLFPIEGYCCSRKDFLGNGNWEIPEAVSSDKLPARPVYGERAVGVLRHEFEIKPACKLTFKLLIGRADSDLEREKILTQLDSTEKIKSEINKVNSFWLEKTSSNYIKTPDEDLDRWTNIWLKYQQIQTVRRGGGGTPNLPLMGFRDMLQHAAGTVLIDPALSKNIIREALHYQYSSGRAVRQWSRHGKHDTRDYRDSPLWIIHALDAYLKESGDLAFLDEKMPYLDHGHAPVIGHFQAALDCLWSDRGQHGLSKIGEGDWLDPLNRCGIAGNGESVWLSMALVVALKQAAELYDFISQQRKAEECKQRAEELKKAIEKHGWDGQWYLQAYDDDGCPVGSSGEERMYLNPQLWAILSGCADKRRIRKLLKVIDEKLKTPFGYMLLYPSYDKYAPQLGNISILQLKDIVYSHANAFKIFADCQLKDGDAALETFKMICPENPENHFSHSGAEPHIIPNGYRGITHSNAGQVLYSGFSGTFPWLLRGVIEQIMGARASYNGLLLSPCIPSAWKECFISRRFRGVDYKILIKRKSAGVHPSIICNGKKLNGSHLPIFCQGTSVDVICELGE